MKVVIFCGGQGMRLRDYSEVLPKPLVPIGYRPIVWHLMKYYAYYGHREFILCLGHKADAIKRYFLDYDECISNDFVIQGGRADPELLSRDMDDWRITFVDTGLKSNIGQRLKAVQRHLEGEEMFLANYSDGLSNVPVNHMIEVTRQQDKTACFAAVRPTASFHLIKKDEHGVVQSIDHIRSSDARINGGFFVFTKDIFNYLKEGEDLVEQPFWRLIENRQLIAFEHDGFWACMDTFKEKQDLEDMFSAGHAPWHVWSGY
jgi:glucose-1-phosphate cytidylyltransferase